MWRLKTQNKKKYYEKLPNEFYDVRKSFFINAKEKPDEIKTQKSLRLKREKKASEIQNRYTFHGPVLRRTVETSGEKSFGSRNSNEHIIPASRCFWRKLRELSEKNFPFLPSSFDMRTPIWLFDSRLEKS